MIRLREPAGNREVGLPCRIGGDPNDDIVVPGAEADAILLDVVDGELGATLVNGRVWLNGTSVPSEEFISLRAGDVLALGAARIVIQSGWCIEVRHLQGNDTIASIEDPAGYRSEELSGDGRITAATWSSDLASEHATSDNKVEGIRRFGSKVITIALVGLVLFGLFAVQLGRLEPVRVNVTPTEAAVSGSGFGWRSAGTLLLLPGERTIRAELEGYESLERKVVVRKDAPIALNLRLVEKPGVIEIDTDGVAASVFVDGAEAGRAPGAIKMMSGARTVTLRSDRHLDHVVTRCRGSWSSSAAQRSYAAFLGNAGSQCHDIRSATRHR